MERASVNSARHEPARTTGPSTGIRGLIEARAVEPGRTAFVDGATGAVATWGDVRDAAHAWADAFASPDPRVVGLLCSSPLEMATNYLGALGAAVGSAPLDPAATPAELAAKCRTLGIDSVVLDEASEPVTEALLDAGCDLWTSDPGTARLSRRAPRRGTAPPAPPGATGLVLASSGTTGDPKIIPLSEAQLLAVAEHVARHHELTADDRGYCPLPLFHVNALVIGVLANLVSGAVLVLDRFSRRRFWATVEEHRATWLNLVPAIINALVVAPPPRPELAARIRFARSASAPLSRRALERFERRIGVPVLETYGMTEAASQITANPVDPADRRPGSVGRPVGVELRVVDADRRPLGPDAVGDVEIRGAAVIDAYWAPAGSTPPIRPATSADGWLRTGDVGRVDRDGFVHLEGRADDVINRGGEKIYPREIEDVLLADPRVVAAVVVGRPHETVGEEPVAFVLVNTSNGERSRVVGELADRCASVLSRYKRPAEITVADTLPCGPTGKVKRRELRARAGVPPTRRGPARRPAPSRSGALEGLELPARSVKPRRIGLTMVIDNGVPQAAFADAIETAAGSIDLLKFGWGTAVVTDALDRKIDCLHANGIRFCFGGTLFEKFVIQNRFDGFLRMCHRFGCDFVEVSNGTIPISNREKAEYVRRCAEEFPVVSEVGLKDPRRSETLGSRDWVEFVHEDLAAGAALVITEARESGRSGICRRDGQLRLDLVEDILASGVDPGLILFEAPTKDLQTQFILRLGPNVNLGNIAPADVIGLETLRLGLRSDTLLRFEGEPAAGRPAGEVRSA